MTLRAGPIARVRRFRGARTTAPTARTPRCKRGEGKGKDGRGVMSGAWERGARFGQGWGCCRTTGRGSDVTQVSSGAADDGRTVPGKMGYCPGPHPPAGGRPLGSRIHVLLMNVKRCVTVFGTQGALVGADRRGRADGVSGWRDRRPGPGCGDRWGARRLQCRVIGGVGLVGGVG
jgi:hypothetical protein